MKKEQYLRLSGGSTKKEKARGRNDPREMDRDILRKLGLSQVQEIATEK